MPKNKYPKNRRMMTKFSIDEISAVGQPAQAPALAVIMKRHGDDPGAGAEQDAKTQKADGKGIYKGKTVVTYESSSVHNSTETRETIDDAGEGGTLTGSIDVKIAEKEGKGTDTGTGDGGGTEEGTAKTGTVEEQLAALQTRVEASEAENAALKEQVQRGEQIAALTPTEKVHYDGLDESAQEEFLGLSKEARAEEVQEAVKKAADENAVIFTALDGTEYRKSDNPQVVALAKQADEANRKIQKMEAEAADREFEKRAEDELKHLPGTVQERAAILKAIETIPDEAQREAALTTLKANNEKLAKAFETVGTSEGDPEDTLNTPDEQLNTLAENLAKSKGISYMKAYDEVVNSPEGNKLYKQSIGALVGAA